MVNVRGRRLRDRVLTSRGPDYELRLPWPMTAGESVGYLCIMLGCLLAGIAVVLWASVRLIEPSPWRFAPTIIWLVLFCRWIGPAIVRSLMPDDVNERRTLFSQSDDRNPL
ncbi:hypothetical protein SAMN06295924_1238 [Rathayibacter rathayi NCPPB 2980 = VKM Ac-1601]|uniref:DUF983 domain-containing protein n=1 Tax=Rathayibacter rathayi TaxID=33887 RepID=A0ABX5A8R4_RATRA|nr:hypothetical protein C5C16_13590 [Rathayibacter rathayi]SOE06017.1 hypothetical protein SAMN06295924_1238 [Rathayibacter rathayi NCPPB 2980 = VKM Ac-1601]PPG74212.1 hypothetical protein C5C15_15285 [Rathayibacter rathayi]PPG87539.1 hypothetical protein C5C47_10195 [Rathayibacter rathayi]PPG95111.1 hypothetical protein C5C00_10865 [Rathayibacter rathayi]